MATEVIIVDKDCFILREEAAIKTITMLWPGQGPGQHHLRHYFTEVAFQTDCLPRLVTIWAMLAA